MLLAKTLQPIFGMDKKMQKNVTNNNERSDQHSVDELERDSGYSRAYTRVLTSTLIDALEFVTDGDQQWTKDLLKSYGKIDEKGPDGEFNQSSFSPL